MHRVAHDEGVFVFARKFCPRRPPDRSPTAPTPRSQRGWEGETCHFDHVHPFGPGEPKFTPAPINVGFLGLDFFPWAKRVVPLQGIRRSSYGATMGKGTQPQAVSHTVLISTMVCNGGRRIIGRKELPPYLLCCSDCPLRVFCVDVPECIQQPF